MTMQDMPTTDPRAGLAIGTSAYIYGAISANTELPFFGVVFPTVGMAFAGSLLAFAYGTPVNGWKRLVGYALGGIFIGIWGVQLIPVAFEWSWYAAGRQESGFNIFQPPLAGFMALVSRWALPLFVESLPALYQRVFNTSRRGDDP